MLHNVSSSSTISSPRSIVLIGGYEVEFLSWTVENTSFEEADTFEIDIPFEVVSKKADFLLSSSSSASSLLFTEKNILVEVYRGVPHNPDNFNKNQLKRNIIGYVDTVGLQFDESGEILKLSGRDMSSLLIDTAVSGKYQNSTSSQIAHSIAAKHGLSTSITSTRTLAGKYFNKNSTITSNTSSEWDLLMFLAQQEGFVVRVKGTTLYFGPVETITDSSLSPIDMTWGDNILSLEIERQPHGARDIEVDVFSYDRHKKKQIVGKAKGTSYKTSILPNPLNRDTYIETYRIPGLNQSQANAKAHSIMQRLSQQQLTGTLRTFGEMGFTVDRKINLHGVGKILSQEYYIARVTETFDASNGFEVEIAFVNQLLMPGGTNNYV